MENDKELPAIAGNKGRFAVIVVPKVEDIEEMEKRMMREHNKKKPPREEVLYNEASALQEAVSCVTKFELKALSLQGAAKKFEKAAGYKDAGQRAAQCRSEADTVLVEGCQEVYELAIEKERNAQVKSDFAEVIEEWKRLKNVSGSIFETRQLQPAGKLEQEAKEHIQFCKGRIAKLESRAAWIRRIVLFFLLAAVGGTAWLLLGA